ncbi:MAG: hypothetical protein IJC46_01340 [Clostridia bacterium]|nr:hypothetical protein [Clostridia bacterium]
MKSRIVTHNGNRFFEINGKRYLPIAARSFRPTPANISLFYRNGVRLFQVQCCGINNTLDIPYSFFGGAWIGDHQYDFSALDKQMEMFIRFAPDAYFMVMPVLDMPDWWREQHHCEIHSFVELTEAAFYEEWKEEAADYLKAFLRHTEEKWGEKVFAYSYSAGRSTEWFDEYGDHPRKVAAFRKAIGKPDAHVPSQEELRSDDQPWLYETESDTYQYLKFCSTLTPALIDYFTAAAQEVLQKQKPIGIFYGYADLPPNWQNQRATNGYEAVWANPDIDMIFTPAAYRVNRLPEGSSSYQIAIDSLPLHNKLYLHEIDHRTHLARYPLDNGLVLQCDYDTEEETVNILRRELCAILAKDAAFWWFDFFGGYYDTPGYEAELHKELAIMDRLSQIEHRSVAEIAVFVDPMSFLHQSDRGYFTNDLVEYNRNTLHQHGAPFDIFNLKDLPRIDHGQYKLYIFLNTLEMDAAVKTYIKENLQNKMLTWLYAPNHFSGGTAEVCDIAIAPTTAKEIEFNGIRFGFRNAVPHFAITDEKAEILARYTDGTPACGRKGNQLYIATGCVPSELWHEIAKIAGVHLYCKAKGSLYADSRFIARQTVHETEPEIQLPFDCVLEELFDGGIYQTKNGRFSYSAPKGETKLFLIKERKNETS